MDGLNPWIWWTFGVVLVVLEVLLPGVFLLWLGLAALLTGGLAWLLPQLPLLVQVVFFSAAAFGMVLLLRRFNPNAKAETAHQLNVPGSHLIGQLATVSEPIVQGSGKVKVGDTHWKARGQDCAVGTRVRITGVQGTILEVTDQLQPSLSQTK